MKYLHFFYAVLLVTTSFDAMSWGQTGHRVGAEIAERYLSEQAKDSIAQLFPTQSLAEISTHADHERANPSLFWKKTAYPWHFVTVAKGKTYEQVGAPAEGDAFTALKAFTKTLQDASSSIEDKRLALHFIVHIIGDLHQPLHNGNGEDRGGNSFKVKYMWQDSNLHRVWDTQIIDGQELSYTEWTDWLSKKITDEQAKRWATADPLVWIAESIAIRDSIYPDSKELSWKYQYDHLPTIKRRLQQSGVRIAAYLNYVFD